MVQSEATKFSSNWNQAIWLDDLSLFDFRQEAVYFYLFFIRAPRFCLNRLALSPQHSSVCVCVLSQLRHSLSTRLQSMQGEESSEEEEEDEACSWSSLPVLR